MAKPVEYTLEQIASQYIGHVLIACGTVLWAGIPLVDALRTGAFYIKTTGGPFPYLTYGGIALTLLGAWLLMRDRVFPQATERFNRDSHIKLHGTGGRARIEAIHGKTKLFGPWVEIYATLQVLEPAYTAKTTVVLNENNLRAFRLGETVKISISPDDRDDIAVHGQ